MTRPNNKTNPKKFVKCTMCGELFNSEFLIRGKCPECDKIFKEWQNGRPKTPEEKIKYKGIRAHYTLPAFKKIYSVYQYDITKYNSIWKKVRDLAFKYGHDIYYRTNPYRVLKLCYVRDEEGNLVHLSDEKHIYRYKALHRICALVAQTLTKKYGLDMDDRTIRYLKLKTGIVYFPDEVEPTAEHEEAMKMCLRDRVKVAIRLYRLLNMDEIEIEKASALAPALNRKLPKDKRKPIDKNKLVAVTKVKDKEAKPIRIDWEKIKASYVKGASIKYLSMAYNVPTTTIFDKVKRDNWDSNVISFIDKELPKMPRAVTLMLTEDEEKAVKEFLENYRKQKRRA